MANYNIGRDATISIIVNGAPFTPANGTQFSFDQKSTVLESQPLNSRPLPMKIPKGWTGTFTYDRGSRVLDDYFAQEEANFWAFGDQWVVTISITIRDPNTSATAQYQFENVVLEYENGGNFEAESKVTQKIKWMAGNVTILS